MQFQPTALILSVSAQREHFDSVRLDTDRPGAAHSAAPTPVREHRVRRSVAALLVRAAGAIEPRPAQRAAVR